MPNIPQIRLPPRKEKAIDQFRALPPVPLSPFGTQQQMALAFPLEVIAFWKTELLFLSRVLSIIPRVISMDGLLLFNILLKSSPSPPLGG